MTSNPRHAQILNTLRADSAVLVRDLAARLAVSESTIRRDLEQLEKQSLLQRVYGGAVLESPPQVEPPFAVRQITYQKEKDLIGRVAAEWVKDGEVLFLDGGTTAQFIVPHLRDRRGLTVVTCGLNIVAELAKYPHISTIVTGGEFHIESQSFTGVMALEALQSYIRCDKAFISCGGVSAKYGVTNRILDRIALKRKAMEISRQVAVIADGSKIGIAVLGHVAPIDLFDLLITDTSAPEDELAAIAALGVEIRTPNDQRTDNPLQELEEKE